MRPPKRIRLGDLLVEHQLITQVQLDDALNEQKKTGRKLGRVLIENGYVAEDKLLNLLSTQLNVPFVDLSVFQFHPEISKIIPETLARRYRVIALEETVDGILIGMADPTNIFAYDELVRIVKKPISMAVVKESEILGAIDKVYRQSDDMTNIANELGEDIEENVFDISSLNQTATQSDAPVVKFIETLFKNAISARASDVHIEPDESVLRIRRRVDGVLQEQIMDDKRIATAVVSKLKLMAGIDISEKRLPQDGRFNLKIQDRAIDVRMSTMPTSTGEAVVMRLLDPTEGILRMSNLGMDESILDRLRKALAKPHGLVLVTGPTGSGKTTTLYAALNELNKPQAKIITVEDPVEYQLPRINQVQISHKIGLNFATVLRASLRQDPDIIFVGEVRDKETAEITLRAAITGHLVLSTLHTNDAISSTLRLIDMGLQSFLVASAIHAVLAQRLVRKVCEHCKSDDTLDLSQLSWLKQFPAFEHTNIKAKCGRGCNACNHTGYQGRIAVHELLEMNSDMTDAIRENNFTLFKRLAIQAPGYQPLALAGLELVNRGITSISEIIRISGWVD